MLTTTAQHSTYSPTPSLRGFLRHFVSTGADVHTVYHIVELTLFEIAEVFEDSCIHRRFIEESLWYLTIRGPTSSGKPGTESVPTTTTRPGMYLHAPF